MGEAAGRTIGTTNMVIPTTLMLRRGRLMDRISPLQVLTRPFMFGMRTPVNSKSLTPVTRKLLPLWHGPLMARVSPLQARTEMSTSGTPLQVQLSNYSLIKPGLEAWRGQPIVRLLPQLIIILMTASEYGISAQERENRSSLMRLL